MIRLSIPGNVCVHCGAVIGESIVCPGCSWADPLTKSPEVTVNDGPGPISGEGRTDG